MKDLVRKSKFLSLILRHKPEVIGIKLNETGWASIPDLLLKCEEHNNPISMEELLKIVKTDDKNRYSIREGYIRANQGHSIKIKVDFKEEQPPDILYHGTAKRFLPSIKKKGLVSQGRNHVHLSRDYDTAITVGTRHGCPSVLTIETGRMYSDGYTFYLSDNFVWLTPKVPKEYIKELKGKII